MSASISGLIIAGIGTLWRGMAILTAEGDAAARERAPDRRQQSSRMSQFGLIAFRCAVATRSAWPPDKKTMPGTAAGTWRRKQRSVAAATSITEAWLAHSLPDITMFGCVSSEGWHVQQEQTCRGRSQSPVVWIAEEMETEPSKPIDKISRGEITSHCVSACKFDP